jgi:hypothetical protein
MTMIVIQGNKIMASQRIHYTKSQTINMGNFESTKIEMGLESDCEFTTDKQFNDLMDFVIKLVDDKLEEKVAEIQL